MDAHRRRGRIAVRPVPIIVSVDFNRNCLKSNILPRFSLTCVPETDRIFAVGNNSHVTLF
jgi:hypothetical protein